MRQNPHVRICGGPGSATTLVYPTSSSSGSGLKKNGPRVGTRSRGRRRGADGVARRGADPRSGAPKLGRRTPGQHLGGGRAARRDKFGGEVDAATVRGQPRGDAGVPTWLRRTGSRPTSYRSHTWSRYRTSRLSSRSGGSSSNSIVTGLAESVAGVNVWCNLRQASAASS